jgi:hypothetical protein
MAVPVAPLVARTSLGPKLIQGLAFIHCPELMLRKVNHIKAKSSKQILIQGLAYSHCPEFLLDWHSSTVLSKDWHTSTVLNLSKWDKCQWILTELVLLIFLNHNAPQLVNTNGVIISILYFFTPNIAAVG